MTTPKKITRELIASLEFRPFGPMDYMGFQGVESPIPLIAESEDFLVIIDGDYAELYIHDYEFGAFDTCENIRELSYKTEKQLILEEEIAKMEKALAELKAQLV